jgi:hypothetical protein
MKMARASEQDMTMAMELAGLLESGYYPMPLDGGDAEDEPSFFDQDDKNHLRVFYERVMALLERAPGGIFRVTGGFHTLMHNDIVDPDEAALEMSPRLKSAFIDAERFRWFRDHGAHTCPRDDWVEWIDRQMLLHNPPPPMAATHSG